jgi:aspartate aminotransferase
MSEINELREKMEVITIEMIKLLKQRTDIAKEIGDIKNDLGKTVTDESRESELREKIIAECKNLDLDESIGTKFLNFLINESVKVQSKNSQTHLTIFLKAKEMEAKGRKIIHLEVGEPDFAPPESVGRAIEHEINYKGFGYGPAKGETDFRINVANFCNENFNSTINHENVLIVPGARFGVFLSISTLLNPGDEMIIIEPAWPAYKQCAINAGVKVRTIKTTLETNWEPTIEQINLAINNNTKMIVLNYPNNPTGKILPKVLQNEIINVAKKHSLFILSDEIYSNYSNDTWKSILSYNYEKSIVTQSFSKSHAMTGYRIGYVISTPEIIEKLTKLQALSLTNVSEVIQFIANMAINSDVNSNSELIRERLVTLVENCKKNNLEFMIPDGSMYVFARIKNSEHNTTDLANKLLENGLAIAPGEAFGDYGEFIRISACVKKESIIEGLNILSTVLKK